MKSHARRGPFAGVWDSINRRLLIKGFLKLEPSQVQITAAGLQLSK